MKPNKAQIAGLLEELGQLRLRAIGIELQREREIKPHRERYEKAVAKTNQDANTRLQTINARLSVLSKDINAQLLAGVDKSGKIALREVTVELETTKAVALAIAKANDTEADDRMVSAAGKPVALFVAEVQGKPGNREIDAKKFFDHVPESEHGAEFFGCLTVGIAPAVKLLGDTEVDKLATKPTRYSVDISATS